MKSEFRNPKSKSRRESVCDAARPENLSFDRRGFLATSAAAGSLLLASPIAAQAAAPTQLGLIDTNISLARWPFRRCPLDETPALVARLRDQGVTQAWAGCFDALLHKDISAVNARHTEDCRKHGRSLLLPIGALNPMLPDWEEDLRRCVEVHRMLGIRVHPNYHRFKLDDPVFERVLSLAGGYNLLVQITVGMEDDRTIHPLVNVPPTDTVPLVPLLKRHPRVRVQLLNAFRSLRGKPVLDLAANGAHFEIATLEGIAGVGNLLKQLPPNRLCFGSHAPFYYFESAKLKLQESALTQTQLAALMHDNARRLLNS